MAGSLDLRQAPNKEDKEVEVEGKDSTNRVVYLTPGLKKCVFYYADGEQGEIKGGVMVLDNADDIARMDKALEEMDRSSRANFRRVDEAEAVQAVLDNTDNNTPAAVQGAMTTLQGPVATNTEHSDDMAAIRGVEHGLASALKAAGK